MAPREVPGSRPRLVDFSIAAVAAAALAALTAIATEQGATSRDLVAYLLAASVGVVLLWRRRHPTVIAVVSLLLVFAYHALGYPAIGNLPLAFALFNASYHSAAPAASAVAAVAVAGSLAWFLVGEARPLSDAVNFLLREMGIMAAVILTGAVLRSRHLLAEESQERVRLAKADQEARAARKIAEDRMEIAREVHDVVAHTVALIGVQARAAADALPDAPDVAAQALRVISDSTRQATAELQATVGLLRDGEPNASPAPRLDQLGGLVESVAASGVDVELDTVGPHHGCLGLVEVVAYRVIQEALTNVVKHSGATRARVEVAFADDALCVVVSDNGVGGDLRAGHGIAGMRERLAAVGGRLGVGTSPDGGLQVTAIIPARRRG